MRVALFGGTGFVGSYLVDALIASGMHPVVLVRSGHEHKLRHPDRCTVVSGDIGQTDALVEMLDGADAVIYNVGILREFPRRGITFDELHEKAAIRTMDAAAMLGANRFLLMSANGVRPDGTSYQATKYRAERYLQTTDLAWTVFRPSVIFGDPRGRMEFASQLRHDIVDSPMPAPWFYDGLLPPQHDPIKLTPVHIEDVAQAFVRSLQRDDTVGQTLHLGGPREVGWKQTIGLIAQAVGRDKAMMPVPTIGISTAASLLERFEAFPITRDQLRMLMEGNTCSTHDLEGLGINPLPFDEQHLAYLREARQDSTAWQKNAA